MGFKQAQVLILLLAAASMVAVGMADKSISATQRWNFGFNYTDWCAKHRKNNTGSNRIIVGGSAKWQFGFNYTDWAMKNGPVYLNDTLVFQFDPPVDNSSHPHSVYLFTDFWSFRNCDLTRARRLADPTQGGGKGFEFRLKRWQPYFFGCGERSGLHCNQGLMKFGIMPMYRSWQGWCWGN